MGSDDHKGVSPLIESKSGLGLLMIDHYELRPELGNQVFAIEVLDRVYVDLLFSVAFFCSFLGVVLQWPKGGPASSNRTFERSASQTSSVCGGYVTQTMEVECQQSGLRLDCEDFLKDKPQSLDRRKSLRTL